VPSIRANVNSLWPPLLRHYKERVEASPSGCRLAKVAFWSLAGSLISRGLGLLSAILVGRMLGKDGFGELGTTQSTFGLFAMLAELGIWLAANKYMAPV
jgi:O-antigen/teichoic acid export membrane protein